MKWSVIFNPFKHFSDQRIWLWSALSLVFLMLVTLFWGLKMDGIMHFRHSSSVVETLLWNVSVVLLAVVVFWLLAMVWNKRTRVVDVCTAVCLSLFPSVIVILLGEISIFKETVNKLVEMQAQPEELAQLSSELLWVSLISFAMLPFIVYSIILLFNGFKTASNAKEPWQYILFFVVLFVMNTLTQILI